MIWLPVYLGSFVSLYSIVAIIIVAICEARIDYAINKYEYDEKLEQAKTGQVSIFDFQWEEDK